jgi:hypothetical protein
MAILLLQQKLRCVAPIEGSGRKFQAGRGSKLPTKIGMIGRRMSAPPQILDAPCKERQINTAKKAPLL